MKNNIIDLIICIFLGYIGAHKFYEGKIKLGLLYLLTVGLFGIGWIVDIFLLSLKLIKNNHNYNNENKSKNNDISFLDKSYIIYPANDFVDDYVVFDFETTGLNHFNDEIIEIGALKYKNNILVSSFNKLIKPKQNISNFVTELTGISNNDVKDCSYIEDILPQFIEFIENYTLVAHNSSFDLSFLLTNMQRQKIKSIQNKSIDTLLLAKKYIPRLSNYKLPTLKNFLNIDKISHRALSDCEVTNAVYQYCKTKANLINIK